jgi:paraquat-inducible protein A
VPVSNGSPGECEVTICPECDAVYGRFELRRGEIAYCGLCRGLLARHTRLSTSDYFALTIAATIFFIVANTAPVLSVRLNGTHTIVNVWLAAFSMRGLAVVPAAVALLATTCIVPAVQLMLLLLILLPIPFTQRPAVMSHLLVTLHRLRPWGMVEVFFLGSLVVIVKLSSFMPISAGPGLWTLAAFTILLAILSRFDSRSIWVSLERGTT